MYTKDIVNNGWVNSGKEDQGQLSELCRSPIFSDINTNVLQQQDTSKDSPRAWRRAGHPPAGGKLGSAGSQSGHAGTRHLPRGRH